MGADPYVACRRCAKRVYTATHACREATPDPLWNIDSIASDVDSQCEDHAIRFVTLESETGPSIQKELPPRRSLTAEYVRVHSRRCG